MIYERGSCLSQLRCTCGKIGPLPEALRHFLSQAPETTQDYALIERVTGFRFLFPETITNKQILICPQCWATIQEHTDQIAKKLFGLRCFSLEELSGTSQEESQRQAEIFIIGTNKWKGTQEKS